MGKSYNGLLSHNIYQCHELYMSLMILHKDRTIIIAIHVQYHNTHNYDFITIANIVITAIVMNIMA